ncbi:hypothetical protein FSARC_13419 [Fusarium sarcochroum]|uniref:Uncharacterized protein n=1 Tax=Fusarium sarcochroum TaxID=1208366 RepID=A0A8H4T1N8_9HYPO|nr:hypothetical protein FSARC_13419 [Fusarium sarcochroum]
MDPQVESQPLVAIPRRPSSVFSYNSLPTAVDENASDLRHNRSVLSIDEDNANGEDSTRRYLRSSNNSRLNSNSATDDPVQSYLGSHPGKPSSDTTTTPFKPAAILVTEQVPAKRASAMWKGIVSKWYPEMLWCFISIGCFVVLVLVLIHYNEEPLPKWPLGLTLNTAIALLTTLSRTGFVLPICECISQLKWLWYRKERPLTDLQTFDEASRGPWGSLKLLVTMRTKAWVLALLPALVMTTSVLTSTVTQSVVTYPTRNEPVYGLPSPYLIRATDFYAGEMAYNLAANRLLGLGLNGTISSQIYTGLNYPVEDEIGINQPSCATSECRWPLFNTLEVCTKIWDVTKYLDFGMEDGIVVNISFSSGISYERIFHVRPSEYGDLVWLTTNYRAVSYGPKWSKFTNTTLFSFAVTYIHNEDPPLTLEVLFHLCVNRYKVTMKENVVSRQQEGSSTKTAYGPIASDLPGAQEAEGDYILSPAGKPAKFPLAYMAFSSVDNRILNDTIYDGPATPSGYTKPATRFAYLFRAALMDKSRGRLRKSGDPVLGVVTNVSRNIAASLSRGMAINNDIREIIGENLGPVVFVKVRWPWLIFLGSQILLSLIFVTIIITRTALSNLGATKSSLLPVLFAISPEVRALVEKITETNEDKYHQEFEKIADGATGVVGMFSPGIKGRGWVLRGPKSEI